MLGLPDCSGLEVKAGLDIASIAALSFITAVQVAGLNISGFVKRSLHIYKLKESILGAASYGTLF